MKFSVKLCPGEVLIETEIAVLFIEKTISSEVTSQREHLLWHPSSRKHLTEDEGKLCAAHLSVIMILMGSLT